MSQTDFYIAQYIRNPLRRETKNVGLFVVKDGEVAGRFLGDSTPEGVLDKRTVPWAAEPKIYNKWLQYWQGEIAAGTEDLLKRLEESNGSNYSVIFGGNVAGVNGDPASLVCERLFPTLVGDAASDEADRKARLAQQNELKKLIKKSFDDIGILGGRVREAPPNPVYVEQPVSGKNTTHTPTFFQQTSTEAYVMEVINFATPRKASATWHAGFVATMFDDIKNKKRQTPVRGAVLVRGTPEDFADKAVKYAFDLLKDSVDRTVNWNDKDQREDFLAARRDAAWPNSLSL